MLVQRGYHLCLRCAQRDWEDDPVVRTAIERNLMVANAAKARCGDCRNVLRVPSFRFCAGCAARERLCQHCCASTLTTEEVAKREAYARWLESYRYVIKQFGIRSLQAKEHLQGCEDDEVRERLAGLTLREIDWPGRKIV
jgi:hypothetical protein